MAEKKRTAMATTSRTLTLVMHIVVTIALLSSLPLSTSQEAQAGNLSLEFGPFNTSYYGYFTVLPLATISDGALQLSPPPPPPPPLANNVSTPVSTNASHHSPSPPTIGNPFTSSRMLFNRPFKPWGVYDNKNVSYDTNIVKVASFNNSFIVSISRNSSTQGGCRQWNLSVENLPSTGNLESKHSRPPVEMHLVVGVLLGSILLSTVVGCWIRKRRSPYTLVTTGVRRCWMKRIRGRLYRHKLVMPDLADTSPESSSVSCFGAVILNVVCGRHVLISEDNDTGGFHNLVDWVWWLHRQGGILEAVDERLGDNYVVEEVERLLLLALACFHPDSRQRPKTNDILSIISGAMTLQIPPFKPAFLQTSVAAIDTLDHCANTEIVHGVSSNIVSFGHGVSSSITSLKGAILCIIAVFRFRALLRRQNCETHNCQMRCIYIAI
ncbi:hypothetical protein K2173_010468 [Erythroxylum novogranatense]|uniref:Uncharacterized protein n=1 Tax=Erythroxylum novogranatense TaxID=1862640 RepID=A0AAV8TE53_9ROSI|nr:hypothetical protein K2173_010468 [Erythroxylum novogranatense]